MTKLDQESVSRGIVLDSIAKTNPNISLGDANKIATDVAPKLVPAYIGDKWFYRTVAISLALIVGIVVVGGILLTYYGRGLDTALIALGSAAVGGLVGIFTTTK